LGFRWPEFVGEMLVPCLFLLASLLGPSAVLCNEEESILKTVKIGGSVTLDCDLDDKPVVWRFNVNTTSLDETDITQVEDKYELDEDKLKVKKIEEDNLGFYLCYNEDDELLKKFEVDVSVRLKKIPKSFSIDQGADITDQLTCSLSSLDHEVEFKWFTLPENAAPEVLMQPLCIKTEDTDCSVSPSAAALFESRDKSVPAVPLSDRAKIEEGETEEGLDYSRLLISSAELEDRQVYLCRATLKGATVKNCTASKECDQLEVLIRVKDPLAALWPFVGIVIEVILLCVIIFFCERRKTPEEKEEYEEGSNGNNIASNSSLRQRK